MRHTGYRECYVRMTNSVKSTKVSCEHAELPKEENRFSVQKRTPRLLPHHMNAAANAEHLVSHFDKTHSHRLSRRSISLKLLRFKMRFHTALSTNAEGSIVPLSQITTQCF